MNNKYKIIPGVGIIGANNNYYIRTVDSNYKLPNNQQLLEELRKILQGIAEGENINAPTFIIQYLLKIKAITNNQNENLNLPIFFSDCKNLGKKFNKRYKFTKKESNSKVYIYYINDYGRLLISKQKIDLSSAITDIELSKEMIAYCEQFILKNLHKLEEISINQALIINVLDYLHHSEIINVSDAFSF